MNENLNEIFRNRTKLLALEIIKIVSSLPYSDSVGILRKQIIRSSTSVAANYRAFTRSRSEKEKYAKICIVVEECDETLFWLEMLIESELLQKKDLAPILNENEELLKVFATVKHKLKYKN